MTSLGLTDSDQSILQPEPHYPRANDFSVDASLHWFRDTLEKHVSDENAITARFVTLHSKISPVECLDTVSHCYCQYLSVYMMKIRDLLSKYQN